MMQCRRRTMLMSKWDHVSSASCPPHARGSLVGLTQRFRMALQRLGLVQLTAA